MNWEFFIGNYGYFALLNGTFLEGETILILAGLAARQGYLYLPWGIVVEFIGTLIGGQLFFFLGRGPVGFILLARQTRDKDGRGVMAAHQSRFSLRIKRKGGFSSL
jgi:membrane protein DedA with SNARE-associated domain